MDGAGYLDRRVPAFLCFLGERVADRRTSPGSRLGSGGRTGRDGWEAGSLDASPFNTAESRPGLPGLCSLSLREPPFLLLRPVPYDLLDRPLVSFYFQLVHHGCVGKKTNVTNNQQHAGREKETPPGLPGRSKNRAVIFHPVVAPN